LQFIDKDTGIKSDAVEVGDWELIPSGKCRVGNGMQTLGWLKTGEVQVYGRDSSHF
jgi:hypothetical protein